MEITRQDREALDELLGFFDDCKDLTEEHVNAMLVILAEHRQKAVAALTKERDGLLEPCRRLIAFVKNGDKFREQHGIAHMGFVSMETECIKQIDAALAALSQPKGGE